jgi:hypothetical protein
LLFSDEKKAEYKKWRMFQSINPWHIVFIEIAIWVTRCKRHYPSVAWGNQPYSKLYSLIFYGSQQSDQATVSTLAISQSAIVSSQIQSSFKP